MLFKSLIFGCSLWAIVLIGKWQITTPRYYPLPYQLSPSKQQLNIEAPILILGGKTAKDFGPWQDQLSRQISYELDSPIKMATLANENWTLLELIEKVNSLKTAPALALIFPGEKELSYQLPYSKLSRYDQKIFNQEIVQTVMQLWPESARLFYLTPSYPKLSSLKKIPTTFDASMNDPQTLKLLTQKSQEFQWQLSLLIDLLREKKIKPLLSTIPFNLWLQPKNACLNFEKEKNASKLAELKSLYERENYKLLLAKSQDFVLVEPANALGWFYLAIANKRMGNTKMAKESILKAYHFDCQKRETLPLFNKIIKKVARDKRVDLFDFNRFIQSQEMAYIDESTISADEWLKMTALLSGKISPYLKY